MADIHITDIEAAINMWRATAPPVDGVTLSPQVRALAEVYAVMALRHEEATSEQGLPPRAYEAWRAWYDTTPDTPCIAICSTSQGDEVCKGCGRTFEEVQRWPEFTPGHKRQVWRRIMSRGSAWRFNRYSERASPRATDRT
jgi:uncharacterized protein